VVTVLGTAAVAGGLVCTSRRPTRRAASGPARAARSTALYLAPAVGGDGAGVVLGGVLGRTSSMAVTKLRASSHRGAPAAGKLAGMSVPDSLNRAKARRAAAHPDRPGQDCGAAAGAHVITVDHRRCEGKGDCVEVCPYGVSRSAGSTTRTTRSSARSASSGASRTVAGPRTRRGSMRVARAACASWHAPRTRSR